MLGSFVQVLVAILLTSRYSFAISTFGEFNTTRNEWNQRRLEPKEKCLIVVADKIKGHLNWMQEWFLKAASNICPQNVVLSENKAQKGAANVVLYHAPTHSAGGSLRANNNNKNNNQKQAIVAMVSMEQPKYSPVLANLKYLSSNVDLMVTYSLSPIYPGTHVPNMPITYWPLNIVSPQSVMQPARSFKDKTGYDTGVTVALFASNCKKAGANERYKYIEELMRYIPIHSYGKCLNNREEPSSKEIPDDPRWPAIAQRRARKIKILSHYKFYLAFENAPIDDYVSEKVFEGLIAGTLPIYKGASSIHRFMPSNDSFVNANGMSPRILADLLLNLGKDEQSYNKHFSFKQKPFSKEFEEMTLKSYVHPNVLCRICSYAMSN